MNMSSVRVLSVLVIVMIIASEADAWVWRRRSSHRTDIYVRYGKKKLAAAKGTLADTDVPEANLEEFDNYYRARGNADAADKLAARMNSEDYEEINNLIKAAYEYGRNGEELPDMNRDMNTE